MLLQNLLAFSTTFRRLLFIEDACIFCVMLSLSFGGSNVLLTSKVLIIPALSFSMSFGAKFSLTYFCIRVSTQNYGFH